MHKWILTLILTLAALWPAAAFCEETFADIPATNISAAAPSIPPRAAAPIPAVLGNITVTSAGPIVGVYPVTPAVAPVLALWREALRHDLNEAGLFSGSGPPLSLQVKVMEVTLTGNTVTIFARYQLWHPGAGRPLTDMDILTDVGVTSTYAINPVIDSAQVILHPEKIGQAVGLNIADFVLHLEGYATQNPSWWALAERAAHPVRGG